MHQKRNNKKDKLRGAALACRVARRKEHMRIFILDTGVLIDYLHGYDLAEDALSKASRIGEIRLTVVSLLELHRSTRSDEKIQADLKEVELLQKAYRLKVVSISEEAQCFALRTIAAHHRSSPGGGLLSDSLILGCGVKKNSCLVTEDKHRLGLADPLGLQVITPRELVENGKKND